MASMKNSQSGLYWTPKGGNNHEGMFASCHKYTSVTKDQDSGQNSETTILIDMGQNEFPEKFADGKYDKVVPALTDCLAIPGQKAPETPASAIFLTHCHSDHIDAVFEYVQMGVKLPPIYGTEYTLKALRAEFYSRGIDIPEKLEMKKVEAGQTIEIGNMKVRALAASHSIPGCLSFEISNGEASIFHSGDTKSDETSSLGKGVDLKSYRDIAGVDFAVWDAANADRDGHSTSEAEACEEYREIFKENADKQIVVAMPAAHMERLASVIKAASATGKHIIINGGATMLQNVMALKEGGYDLEQIWPNVHSSKSSVDEYDPKNTIVITTGVFGEKNSPFVKKLKMEESDFVLQDDAVIVTPAVGKDVDKGEKIEDLVSQYCKKKQHSGIRLITAKDRKIASSGHAQKEDLFNELLPALNAKVNIPTHTRTAADAEAFMRELTENGYGTLSEYPRNGYTVHVTKQGCEIVAKEDVKWVGLRYSKEKSKKGQERPSKMLGWKIEGDHGFSTGKETKTKLKDGRLKKFYYEHKTKAIKEIKKSYYEKRLQLKAALLRESKGNSK